MTETGPIDGEQLLVALADPRCRALLAAMADASLTVAELSGRCDIPTSTTYRKVDRLVAAGILTERIRIVPGGRNAREYALCVETISVDLSGSSGGAIDRVVDARANGPPRSDPGETGSGPVSTYGGTTPPADPERDDETRQQQLRSLFVEVTGTETVVAEQEETIPRVIDGEESSEASSEDPAVTVDVDGRSAASAESPPEGSLD